MPTFDELRSLARFLDKNKVKNIQVIGNPDQSDTLFKRFYEGLTEGKLDGDSTAKEALYGTSEDKQEAYYTLKERLHKRLQNTLFFIDVNEPSRSSVHKAWLKCSKELIMVKILLSNHERRLAILQAERTLKVSSKFEFTDISLDIAKLLLKHYALFDGNKK